MKNSRGWQLWDTFRVLLGVHFMHTICCFKSQEVRSPTLQTVHELELKQRSYGRLKTTAQSWAKWAAKISLGVSQLRNHPLAHECHFPAPYAHFAAAKWAAKIPPLQNPLPAAETISKLQKWDAIFFFMFHFSFWLPNGYKNGLQASKWAAKFPFGFSQPHSYPLWNSPWAAKMFLFFLWAAKMCFFFPLAEKWPPSYEMICENTLWSQGKFQKCQESLATMLLKRRALSLRSHMKPLTPFLTS